jgi:hypothetical protein
MQDSIAIERRDPDDTPVWSLRGVDLEVRKRMKVQAVLRGITLPEVVEIACRFWLAREIES